jgi:hypothetical protein
MNSKKYLILTALLVVSNLVTACGAPATQDPFIQTAVAQTVAARSVEQQNPTEPPVVVLIPETTRTPLQFSPTLTPLPFAATATTPNTYTSPCGKASFVSETIVDGTIFQPGSQFTKTWEIKNTSTCTWDTNYKIVYWGGDNMLGGATYYNLPQSVSPGATVPISLQLTAPVTDGNYTSKWALQTPDNIVFGVGEYSNVPFTVKIVVSSLDKPKYSVTNVTYKLVRDPATGCPANVWYYAYATVSTDGPLQFKYYWAQSDGHDVHYPGIVKIASAGNTELPAHSWKFHIADSPGPKWMMLVIGITDGDSYTYTPYPPGVEFVKTCGS